MITVRLRCDEDPEMEYVIEEDIREYHIRREREVSGFYESLGTAQTMRDALLYVWGVMREDARK